MIEFKSVQRKVDNGSITFHLNGDLAADCSTIKDLLNSPSLGTNQRAEAMIEALKQRKGKGNYEATLGSDVWYIQDK